MQLQQNVPLAPLTTFKVGGPARHFVRAENESEVGEAVDFAREKKLPLFVLGGGSNLVIADSGFSGLVLQIGIGGISQSTQNGAALFSAGAGEGWDRFVAYAVERNCGGIECMSGIPGTVGGTPVQNVGAYGQEVADTITGVRVLDLQQGQIREIENRDSGFAYRSSVFNTSARGRYIVLQVTFRLTPGASPRIEYGDLKKFFAGGAAPPTLAETRAAVRSIRRSKAMLIEEGDPDCRSAGSFFKNPMVTPEECQRINLSNAAHGERVPQFTGAEGRLKISAAWLVEHAGFHRGYSRGAVGISSKHALAIINRGGATAAEIIALKNDIQSSVQDRFGIALQPEPVFVGFDPAK
ncbi:MAG TPA: UDP-N-acetylmuramate dehydrogenase [Terriglobales bacterium]|nr:UDP-N-acetylmuramate dehydrogenase [Terriglobales bacterium]